MVAKYLKNIQMRVKIFLHRVSIWFMVRRRFSIMKNVSFMCYWFAMWLFAMYLFTVYMHIKYSQNEHICIWFVSFAPSPHIKYFFAVYVYIYMFLLLLQKPFLCA